MPLKSLKLLAIVNKKKPKLDPYELYSISDKKQIYLHSDEKVIQVVVTEALK